MEAGSIISIIICICTAFITMLLGTIIYRGNVGLIAGYDPDKVIDKEGLTKWAAIPVKIINACSKNVTFSNFRKDYI